MSQNNYCIVFAIFAAMVQQVAAQDQVGESAPTALGYWLIALMVGTPLIMVLFNVMIVRYYNDKDDDWQAYFPKTVAVLALTFAESTIFLLPLDHLSRYT